MKPLEGLFVLDFSSLLPGPMTTLILAGLGAEVLKVERPDRGDEMRSYVPKWGKDSINHALLNRGKKSVALDLKNEDDRRRLQPLLERADILVEQFRPGVMARLGLSFESARKINPRLIYCSITGYGQTGPKHAQAGHDLNYIGDAGLLGLSMGKSPNFVVPPVLIADIAGGTYPAVLNILVALRERDRTGTGCYLDIAMTENLFPFLYWALGNGLAASQWPGNGTDLTTGGTPRYSLYATADDFVVAAAPIEQKFWELFCEAISLEPSLRDDSINASATKARVAELIRAKPAEHWRTVFGKFDCCCSIVADLKQALADPHFAARGVFASTITNETGAALPALPMPFAPIFRAEAAGEQAAPSLGADNKEYLNARGSGA